MDSAMHDSLASLVFGARALAKSAGKRVHLMACRVSLVTFLHDQGTYPANELVSNQVKIHHTMNQVIALVKKQHQVYQHHHELV